MYFVFKHVKNSPYRDRPGKYYHYTTASPNYKKVKPRARVLCYQKETDRIFARARVRKVMARRVGSKTTTPITRATRSSRGQFFLRIFAEG